MRDVWWVIDDGCLNDYLDGSISTILKTRIAVLHYTEVGTKKLQFVNDYIFLLF